MRFQTLLLSLIILVSFLITGINSPEKSSAEENSASETTKISSSLFIKDFYSAFKEKTIILTNNNIIKIINQNTNFIKQIASANLNNFFSNNREINNSILFADNEAILTSKVKIDGSGLLTINLFEPEPQSRRPEQNRRIDLPQLICGSEIPQLAVKSALIKYLNYLNPSIKLEQVIFELNPENRWPIASLTKLMTSVITMEKIDLNKKITMSAKAIATEGTAGNFKVGEIYKVEDLIKAMLISSSNDAAVAIIENFGEIEFIDEMQKKAAELKMFQTSYLESTGLSFINQSTANDLTKLINYIYQKHPELLEISRQKETEIQELISKKWKKLLNVNKFAGEPDFIGELRNF